MNDAGTHHDRAHHTPDRDATIASVLDNMRLTGAVFLRGEYTEPWANVASSGSDSAKVLYPSADSVSMFHVVAEGRCWVALSDGQRFWASAGDVIVVPYGDVMHMGGVQDIAEVPLMSLLDPPPWTAMPVARCGGGGDATSIVCAYVATDAPLFDPALAALPRLFVIRPDGPTSAWVQATIDYSIRQTAPLEAGGGTTPTDISLLLLRELLKLYLRDAPVAGEGWFAALDDPVLSPALAAIHGSPQSNWTVDDLAEVAGVSSSLLDKRFRELLGRPPIRYLAEWRMNLSCDYLRSTTLPIAAVARKVGYDSEEAFSRAFKRTRGMPPGRWRASEHT